MKRAVSGAVVQKEEGTERCMPSRTLRPTGLPRYPLCSLTALAPLHLSTSRLNLVPG